MNDLLTRTDDMGSKKRKKPKPDKKPMTAAQKRKRKEAKAERQRKYEWIFINGKQVRIKRPETIDEMDSEEFIINNADVIWRTQNGRYDILHERFMQEEKERLAGISKDDEDV